MGFSRQEYWSELPFPPLGLFPTHRLNHVYCVSCIGRWILLLLEPPGKPPVYNLKENSWHRIAVWTAGHQNGWQQPIGTTVWFVNILMASTFCSCSHASTHTLFPFCTHVPACSNFVHWLYNRSPGRSLLVTELRELWLQFWHHAPVAFHLPICFSPKLRHIFLYVHSWRGPLTTPVSRFDGLLSTLLFYKPRISGLPGTPWYLIMRRQEVFFQYLLCFHFRHDWILQKPLSERMFFDKSLKSSLCQISL